MKSVFSGGFKKELCIPFQGCITPSKRKETTGTHHYLHSQNEYAPDDERCILLPHSDCLFFHLLYLLTSFNAKFSQSV